MSHLDIVYAITCFGMIIGATFVFFRVNTWKIRIEDRIEGLRSMIGNHMDAHRDPELPETYVELHSKVLQHQALIENLELRHTDMRDIVERRFNRLSTRQSRADREGVEHEEPVDDVDVRQMQMELNGAEDQVQQPQPTSGRRRLVRRSGREPYRR